MILGLLSTLFFQETTFRTHKIYGFVSYRYLVQIIFHKFFHSIATANGYKITGGDSVLVATIPSTTVLKIGMNGAEVKKLQQVLTGMGYITNGTDGIFGPATEAAVKKFQQAKKLKADGVVGPSTKKALGMN